MWEAASLVDTDGTVPQVAVGDGVMAVTTMGRNGAVLAAVSLDGGETWAETVVDPRPAVVHGVEAIGSAAYVFGEVLKPTDPTWGEGTPVVWRHDDQGWAAIEDLAAGGGAVTGVLRTSDGSVRAFGQRGEIAASWGVGDALEPVAVGVPPALGWFVAVGADGRREVLGMDVGDSEDGAFWTAFLRSLKARGLTGVQLVISDAHTGLKAAINAVLIGSSWQRCRVHFMRNVLAVVPKGNSEMVAAAIRTVFAQPDAARVSEQFDTIAVMLGRQLPKVQTMMVAAKDDLLAFSAFPQSHWRQLWSTNPLERTNKEIKRRTDVVGVFPNPAALLRLAGAVLVEQHDEWAAADRRYFSERSMALLVPEPDNEGQVATPELMTA